jgi:hypothetical protein
VQTADSGRFVRPSQQAKDDIVAQFKEVTSDLNENPLLTLCLEGPRTSVGFVSFEKRIDGRRKGKS